MTPARVLGVDIGIDSMVWSTALDRVSGSAMSDTNEFVQAVQFALQPTHSSSSYEKDGRIIQGVHNDPSTGTVTKDGVADDARMQIGGSNPSGRAWARYTEVGVNAGGDGMCIGEEIGGHNQGSEQPELDTPTSKVLRSFVAGEYPGDKRMTAITYVEPGTASFFRGHVVNQYAMSDQQNGECFAVRGTTGDTLSAMRANGDIAGQRVIPRYLMIRFEAGPSMPAMQPGEAMIWGDTSTGTTYFVFYDGGNHLKTNLVA